MSTLQPGHKTCRAITLAFVLLIAACTPAVALPGDAAGPEIVLDTYLRALVAGDCDTGRKLAAGAFARGHGDLCGGAKVTAYEIDPVPARPSPNDVVFHTYLTTTGSDDGSILPGDQGWFSSLSRQPNGPLAHRWRRDRSVEDVRALARVGDSR